MFARTVTVKGKKYWRIVKSYRDNGKVKQAYVCAMGEGETGRENAQSYLDDISDYIQRLESVRENPKIMRLVNRILPDKKRYEDRRKGQNDCVWTGRAKKIKCPVIGGIATIRVLRDSGQTICLDSPNDRKCKGCEWKE